MRTRSVGYRRCTIFPGQRVGSRLELPSDFRDPPMRTSVPAQQGDDAAVDVAEVAAPPCLGCEWRGGLYCPCSRIR